MKLGQMKFGIIVSALFWATAAVSHAQSEASRTDTAAEAETAASPTPTASPSPSPAAPARTLDVVYVPTHEAVVDEMLRMAEVKGTDVLYDLGSGDGRIPITAAKRFGTRGLGIDLDPNRVAEANQNAEKAKVTDKVKFIEGDLFEQDLSEATVISLYLLPELNLRLMPTLKALKPGTRIVSHNYDMGDWKPEQSKVVTTPEGVEHDVYFWRVPAAKEGE